MVGTSQCVAGIASAAVVDMHTPVTTACAQTSPPVNLTGIILGVALPIVCTGLIAWLYYRQKMKNKLGALRQELETFKDSVRKRGSDRVCRRAERGAHPACLKLS